MSMIPAFQLATAPDEPQSAAVLILELMPAVVLTYTETVLAAPAANVLIDTVEKAVGYAG